MNKQPKIITKPCRSPYCEVGKCSHPGFHDARHLQVEKSYTEEWLPANQPPLMKEGEFGWPSSEQVLSYGYDGKFRVVTFELIDEDSEPVWFSNCSERWNLNGVIMSWKAIKSPD